MKENNLGVSTCRLLICEFVKEDSKCIVKCVEKLQKNFRLRTSENQRMYCVKSPHALTSENAF